MAIYYSSCALSMLIAWILTHTKYYHETGKIRYAVLFSALPLFLVAALRYGVGTDYFNYVRIYKLAERGIDYKSELVFNIMINLLAGNGFGSQSIFVLLAGIFCVFTYLAIFKESPFPMMSIFLLIGMTHYFAFLNIMRQLAGGAIVLYAMTFIEKKDFKKYLIFVLLATGLHYSCIIFLPFYWINKVNLKPYKVIILSVVIVWAERYIEEIALNLVEKLGYSWYIGSRYDTGTVGYIYMLLQIVIDVFLIFTYDDSVKYKTLFGIQIVSTWAAFFSGKIVMIERLRYLLGFPAVILIPLAISNIKNKIIRNAIIICITILFFIYSYLVTTSGNNGVLPYKSILK